MHAATFFDGERWREGVVVAGEDGRPRLGDAAAPSDAPRLAGRVLGGFTDHHVHLQLVDHGLLATSRLGRVIDLGGNPAVLRALAVPHSSEAAEPGTYDAGSRPSGAETPELRTDVRFAGAFLTPPGGYPSDRDWAPAGSVREVADEGAAAAAVAEMAGAGASCLKVASNSTAGPVFDDDLFRAIVGLAAAHRLPVVAHAEGPGEAQRVVRLGATRLAHAPFTERLDDAEVARQAATASWISTIAIHDDRDRATALDNVRRFLATGGTVLYGTDMGNGPTPVDLHPAELSALREAGLHGDALLRALAPVDPLSPSAPLLLLPDGSTDPCDARPLTAADLKV